MNYGSNKFKRSTVKFVMGLLGKALEKVSTVDEEVRNEAGALPDGFIAVMTILPNGPSMRAKKEGDHFKYLGTSNLREDGDLVVMFKNLESAFMILTGQLSTHRAYAQHRVSVKGDIVKAMIFTRCLNVVQAYLFPGPLANLVLKRKLPMPLNRQLKRLQVFLTLPF